ncbi:MAG TPA: MarR family transcriptional regulator [Streptosporangiaceae bacterium]
MGKELAVTLFDLAWLLPRTIGAEDSGGAGLPYSELEVMRLLVRQPGLSVNEVASALELQSSNVSTAIRSLVARGLIERRRDERDGRVTRLYPTRTAIAHRDGQEAAWGKALARCLAQLPDAERERLLAAAPALEALAGLLR